MYSRILVTGIVQSVGFRPFIKRLAEDLGTTGHVKNLGSVGVEIVVEQHLLDIFIHRMEREKPELSAIYSHEVEAIQNYEADGFTILRSTDISSTTFSPLPPDISMCNGCRQDLDVGRRVDYPFISCTDCGPRYAVIRGLPYDREKTSFAEFPLCTECGEEYTSLSNRRFHAQTTCCSMCGPSYELRDSRGGTVPLDWKVLVERINYGDTLFMQGQSGSHLICSALVRDTVEDLRRRKRQESNKPFALMARSLGVVEKYCKLTDHDKKMLHSSRRPIVVLPVREGTNLPLDVIAPGLDTVGLVLPYTAAQHLLFKKGMHELVVLTSANEPGLPMPIREVEPVFGTDFYLMHNLYIEQRVDDSVLKSLGDHSVLIRRARGYVPQPLHHTEVVPDILALGANEVVTGAFSSREWVTVTQHIGNMRNIENLDFLRDAVTHLRNLYGFRPQHLVVDLHPDFLNRRLVEEFSDTVLHEVQHHEAHVYSLLLDRGLAFGSESVVWAVDGFGYGHDGNAWGTELYITSEDGIERIGSAVPISYHGNDANAKYPARMLLSYLKHLKREDEWTVYADYSAFNQGEAEYRFLCRRFGEGITTSSVARFLDAVSFLIGAVGERTYRGEPAIRLEAAAGRRNIEPTRPFITGNLVDTPRIMEEVLSIQGKGARARFAHDAVATSLAELAIGKAEEQGISRVGFTGGVAYNYRIDRLLGSLVEKAGMEFIRHRHVPPGDGGISAGQVAWLSSRIQRETP